MSRILITGASQGLGRATALELIGRGHDVIATARDVSTLADLGAAESLQLDVTDQGSVDAAVLAAGHVDVFVSNAGQTTKGTIESTPLAEYDRLFQLNTVGAVRVTQAVLPQMRDRGRGRVLYVSSILGRIVLPLGGAYAATKWALEAIAETLAIEAAPFGIDVALLQPGRISTHGPANASVFVEADDPYVAQLPSGPASSEDRISAEEAARTIADAVEVEDLPLRVPVGVAAILGLQDLRRAPADAPFIWTPRIA